MTVTLDVLCVGVATIDTIARIHVMPSANERVVSEPFVIAGGGPAATAAVTLARLGKRVGFCGVIGDDEAGHRTRNSLDIEGVDTTWLKVQAGVTTAQSMVVVSGTSANRAIITTRSTQPLAEDIPTDVATWIHVDQNGYTPTRKALTQRPSKALLSIDGGNPITDLNLAGINLYAPTLETLCSVFHSTPENAFRQAIACGAAIVVATDGARGTYVYVEDNLLLVNSFKVSEVSTMGAGDVFHGALLAAILNNETIGDAVMTANAAAALSCRALDGRSRIPSTVDLKQFLSGAVSGGRA